MKFIILYKPSIKCAPPPLQQIFEYKGCASLQWSIKNIYVSRR